METQPPGRETLCLDQEAATALLLWQFRLHPRTLAVRELGTLAEHDIERLLERSGAPREPWPDWMPGEAPASDFYFD